MKPHAVEPAASPAVADFAQRLLDWHALHGRQNLPWQGTRDPYRVWLSEIMLQQTQVETVRAYYARFLARFPAVGNLAAAPLDEVLALWSGLGYYARARNLHRAAQLVVSEHGGRFPASAAQLQTLPGIGRSTAAAIAAFCHDAREPILDGNVKRVLCRAFGIHGWPGERAVEQRLWALAASLLPSAAAMPRYTQAQMDLGATLCARSRPRCTACPLADICVAHATGQVAQLPTPRPRRARPHRRIELALVCDASRVLLVRRPPQGLWGGLWSLPEAAALPPSMSRRIDTPQLDAEPHAFSHFTAEFLPTLHVLTRPAGRVREPGQGWFTHEDALALGLPAPIRRILQRESVRALLLSGVGAS